MAGGSAGTGEDRRLDRAPVVPARCHVGVGNLEDLRCPAELTDDGYQSGFQQAALVEVIQQG